MRVDLDAKVLTRDGEELGTVQRAVVRPDTMDVTDFVINTGGLLGRDVLLPIEEIERAARDGDVIRLELTREQAEDLPAYVPAEYVPPPQGWSYSGGYPFGPHGGFVWPTAYADSYAGSTAPTASADEPVPGSVELSIGKGAVVIDRDGEDIGVVDDIRFDEATGRLSGFVLRLGGALRTMFGGGDTVEIDRASVVSVEEGAVYLTISQRELERRA